MGAITVHLTPDEQALAEGLVAEGRYETVEEALRDGVRVLDAEARRWDELWAWDGETIHRNPDGTRNYALPGPPMTLEELREEIRKGEEGPFIEVTDIDAFFAEIEAEVEAEFAAERESGREPGQEPGSTDAAA